MEARGIGDKYFSWHMFMLVHVHAVVDISAKAVVIQC